MSAPGNISWKHVSEDDFNRFVEALIVKESSEAGLEAFAIDGRGGDGGIDIDVKRDGKTVHVYQLKHFPKAFLADLVRLDVSRSKTHSTQR